MSVEKIVDSKKVFLHLISQTYEVSLIPSYINTMSVFALYICITEYALKLVGKIIKGHELCAPDIALGGVTIRETKVTPEIEFSFIELSY
jgi:hypothetical protein